MVAKTSESISLSKVKKIYGVEIKKMPCGKYFEALQTLKDLPQDFIKEISNGKEDFKLSEMFTIENIINLMMELVIVLPDFTFRFLSKLMDMDEEVLKNNVTPKELIEIVKEFWKINELESFFDQMKPIVSKFMTLIGFKEQLQSALK